jgi:hypothetical protein
MKEKEIKKLKVFDYHFDSSRILPQFIQPMQSADLSQCFVDEKEAEKELTNVPD